MNTSRYAVSIRIEGRDIIRIHALSTRHVHLLSCMYVLRCIRIYLFPSTEVLEGQCELQLTIELIHYAHTEYIHTTYVHAYMHTVVRKLTS